MTELDAAFIRGFASARVLPRVAVRGESMQPLLHAPMVLELGPPDGARIGDIVVFFKDGVLIAHRLFAKRNGTYYTCGDAQPWIVERVEERLVVGRVVAVYADARPDAGRIDDDRRFVSAGIIRARLRRCIVARHHLLRGIRRLRRLMLRKQTPAFRALILALRAALAEDHRRFGDALSSANPYDLLEAAERHRCTEILRKTMVAFGSADPSGGRLGAALQSRARETAVDVFAHRRQIDTLVSLLSGAGIEFALLKGAARCYASRPEAPLYRSDDIDILVPRAQIDAARAALVSAGYRERVGPAAIAFFRKHHHHIATLFPKRGKAVELHVALAPPGTLEPDLDWERLSPHMTIVEGPAGPARILDDFGEALHLAVHAIGLGRLRDVYLLALALRNGGSTLATKLRVFIDHQTVTTIPIEAMLALAARLGGTTWVCSERVERYVAWLLRREEMPRFLARHSGIVEAFLIDGSLFGPSFQRLTQIVPFGPTHPLTRCLVPLRLVKRLMLGIIAALYAAAAPIRGDDAPPGP